MDWGINKKETFVQYLEKGTDNNFAIEEKLFKGVAFWRLRGLTKSDNEKSIYKLVLKKEWTTDSKENFEEKGVQGALGLVKVTWGGEEKMDIDEEFKM